MVHTLASIKAAKKPNCGHVTFDAKQEDFRMVAIRLHAKQMYGDFPYAYHLAMVEQILADNNYAEWEYRVAAWLHDAIEDTVYARENAFYMYGSTVEGLIWGCTGVGANRKERNASIYAKLKENPDAAPVKVADRLAHMRFGAMTKGKKLGMYLSEFGEFSENVRPLMTGTTRGALLWNKLEQATQIGGMVFRQMQHDLALASVTGMA